MALATVGLGLGRLDDDVELSLEAAVLFQGLLSDLLHTQATLRRRQDHQQQFLEHLLLTLDD